MPKCNLQIFFLSDIVYVLWLLVPSEWPHTKKFHFAFPKYIQNPLSERNVSHNLYRKENVPIITQWFYTTNMSQPHHPTTIKWGHSFVYSNDLTKILFTLPDISYHSHFLPQMSFSCFWEGLRMLPATCALRDKSLLWVFLLVSIIQPLLPMTF